MSHRLSPDRLAWGGWCSTPSITAAGMMAAGPFDYVVVDTQHGWVTEAALRPMLLATAAPDRPTLVRVPANNAAAIGHALDWGADGVIVPLVNSADDAAAAAAACRYPPDGDRSWGQGGLGRSPSETSARVICLAMIETPAGVANADAIARTPGVDGIYIGPSDLALSHGMTPTYTVRDAAHRALIERIIAVGRSAGTIVGLHCPTVREALTWADSGVSMLTAASDVILLRQGLADVAEALRTARP